MTTHHFPNWLGSKVGSINELMEALYPHGNDESEVDQHARGRLAKRADRLLFSYEMGEFWKRLDDKDESDFPTGRFRFFWAAMNVETLIATTAEPNNSAIKDRYTRIANLASDLRNELREFSQSVGASPYSDLQKTIASLARSGSPDKQPDDTDLAYALISQEVQSPHHGFDDGRLDGALSVLAEAARIVSFKRQSRNRITRAQSDTRTRNEIALAMSKAALDYLNAPCDDAVASTVNSILDLVEDGEAMTGDQVKKLRKAHQGKIFPPE